ncbi:GlxA family transcriptional regulator [Methylovirgula sp. 4M-Z18]|uniref:GlxA family transcriptional regulator n=1 Tax=Methylovirgula sp. 4M-Z18 TaxID=2293567 RepID=UPI000E2F379D|nr:GlxA family transcriptional regulator [Methylovirgula sp. 4M-Z18]RFB79232.1 GlxA family transcriptional regulator [Methylovirgula sp. 4M-Z18]
MSKTLASANPYRVIFVLVPDFSMIAFTSAIEALRLANRVSGTEAFTWACYSPDGKPVAASNGVPVTPQGAFTDLKDASLVVVCGGVDIQKADLGPLIARLRKLSTQGVALGALCTGPYVLARAGLLNGYRCTIHWENFDSFREEFPALDVTQELFEIDRNRYTCAGGTAAIDMMLRLIATRCDTRVAALVTDELIHHRMREPNERQRMELRSRLGVAHPKLLAVVAEMEKRLEHPASCSQLAKIVSLSPRQLERLFQKYLDTTPTRHYLTIRLQRARQLLLQTSIPILSVGIACGFVSASHFSKCYSEHFKRTPSEERKGKRLAPMKDILEVA